MVQSPLFNPDETVITSLGNEKSLSMLIWVLYGQTAKFETGGNCRMSSMYIKNIPIERKFARKSDAERFQSVKLYFAVIALWVMAGILTSLLFTFCCYYCCWHVCCGRYVKRQAQIIQYFCKELKEFLLDTVQVLDLVVEIAL